MTWLLYAWLGVGVWLALVLDPEPEFSTPGQLAAFYAITMIVGLPALTLMALAGLLGWRR